MANGVKPHELIQLCTLLDKKFQGKILGTGTDAEAKKRNYYSKALAAYFLTQEAGATDEDAVNASIDGGGDHGIDSVYMDNAETIWLVQSKYKDRGEGEVELADVGKFVDGVRDLAKQKYDRFNEYLQEKVPQLNYGFDSGSVKIKAVLAYTGNALSDDRRRLMSDLEEALNQPADPRFLKFLNRGLASFHRLQLDEYLPQPISAEITIENYGHISAPYLCYFGSLSGEQLKALKDEYSDQLFDANIRHFQGSTVVNQDISKTIVENPEHFFYFNNGVTFICDSFKPIGPRDDTRSTGRFRVENLSVINGAQTVSSLSHGLASGSDMSNVKVLATFITLDAAPVDFGSMVTRYRNNQNAVSDVDFASLDENQVQWAQTLQQSGVNYRYKSGDLNQEDFNVEIAAKALACWISGNDWCQLVAQAKKDGKKLFTRIAGAGLESPTYNRLFRDSLQARQLWRIVQIHLLVSNVVKSDSRQAAGVEKGIIRNSTFLLSHIVYIRFQYVDHRDLKLSLTHENLVRTAAQTIVQTIASEYQKINWNKTPESVFKNATDLNTLKGRVMAELAQA